MVGTTLRPLAKKKKKKEKKNCQYNSKKFRVLAWPNCLFAALLLLSLSLKGIVQPVTWFPFSRTKFVLESGFTASFSELKEIPSFNPQAPDGVYKPPLVYCRMGFINTIPFPALHLSRNAAIVFESLKISDQHMAKRY